MKQTVKIKKISQVFKEKRLDGFIDYGLLLEMTDGTEGFLSIRITNTSAISYIVKGSTHRPSFEWVSIPKKRTLNASVKQLFSVYPKAVSNDSKALRHINSDDSLKRKQTILEKRQWKVHQYAVWPNGFFLARLSCTKCHESFYTDTQFILFPTQYQSPDSDEGKVYSQHGRWRNDALAPIRRLKYALKSESLWPSLSKMLHNVVHGYSTASEAEVGFQAILALQGSEPTTLYNTNKINAKRQHIVDKDIKVLLLDHFQSVDWQAWVFRCEDHYFIMKEKGDKPGIVNLDEQAISTAFTTPEESAQALASLYYDRGSKSRTGASELTKYETRLTRWKQIIIQELRGRYFVEQIRGSWLINAIAIKSNRPIAVLFQSLAEPSYDLPPSFKALTYRMLQLNLNKQYPSWEEPVSAFNDRYYGNMNISETEMRLNEFIKSPATETLKRLDDFMYTSRGHYNKKLIYDAFAKVDCDDIRYFDGEACPLNAEHKQNHLDFKVREVRQERERLVAEGRRASSIISDLENTLQNRTTYPDQLIDAALSLDLCERRFINTIEKNFATNRDVLFVDVFNVNSNTNKSHIGIKVQPKKVASNSVQDEHRNIATDIQALPSTSKRNEKTRIESRKIHKDDKERKRVWAKKKRAELRAEKIAKGEIIGKPGRKKLHANTAAKQREYRFRVRWENRSKVGILLIQVSAGYFDEGIINKLKNILPLFSGRSYFIVGSTEEVEKINNSIFPEIPLGQYHVLINKSRLLCEDNLARISKLESTNYYMAGTNIAVELIPLALGISDLGHKVFFAKELCKPITREELKKTRELIKLTDTNANFV